MTDTNYLYEYFLKKSEDSQSEQENKDQSDDEQSQDKE